MTAIPQGFSFNPFYSLGALAAPSSTSQIQLNTTTRQRIAWIFQVPRTGTIDAIEFRIHAVSTPGSVRYSLQDVDASGYPDGSVDQFRVQAVPASGWSTPGLLTSDGTDGGTKRSVTAGQVIALVAEWDTPAGTVDFSANAQGTALEFSGFPYSASHNGTSWSRSSSVQFYYTLAIKYSTGVYALPSYSLPITAVGTIAPGSGSTPDEIALRFSPPVGLTIAGAQIKQMSMSGSFDLVLYDSSSVVLATINIDQDWQASTSAHWQPVYFSSEVALVAGQTYRLAVKPSGAGSVNTTYYELPSAAIRDAMLGIQGACYSTRTDGGAWTDNEIRVPYFVPVFTAIETGGGLREPGAMSGGLI